MTLILDLPPEMETAIRQDADRQGTTPEALALESLRRLYPQAELPDADQQQRHALLAGILAEADTLTLMPPEKPSGDPSYAAAILEKYRDQGFHL